MLHICLGLLCYEQDHSCLPMASELGPDGRSWHSWKSSIYPNYIVTSRSDYNRLQPWDSATNLNVAKAHVSYFCCPAGTKTHNDYCVVVGSETAFPPNAKVKLSQIRDGLENTILVVESAGFSTSWTEPKDLMFDTMSFTLNAKAKPSISSNHSNGAYVGFADGASYFLTDQITESELRALLTISGGEDVTRKDLLERGVLR